MQYLQAAEMNVASLHFLFPSWADHPLVCLAYMLVGLSHSLRWQ